jgi:hypothetical protein
MAMIAHGAEGGRLATVAAFGHGVAQSVMGAARGGMLGQPAPQVTVQVPTAGLNAATGAALVAMAGQMGKEVASFISRVTPYAKFGFYTFMVLLCLHIVEKGVRVFGPTVVAAAKALLVVARVGVKMSSETAKVFLRLSARVIAALYSSSQAKARQIFGVVVRIQNMIGHGINTVKSGAAAMASAGRRASTAVVGALGRSAARLRTAGSRLKKAHVSYKKRQAVKAEETRVKGLISKVRKSNAPLTLKEKQEYLKMAHKANSVAAKAAKVAASAQRKNVTMVNAASALKALKRKRSH